MNAARKLPMLLKWGTMHDITVSVFGVYIGGFVGKPDIIVDYGEIQVWKIDSELWVIIWIEGEK